MLSIGRSEDHVGHHHKLLAVNETTKEHIYWTVSESEDLPAQRTSGTAFQLISDKVFHKIVKKWNLTKKEVKTIRSFYNDNDDHELLLDEGQDSYRVRSAFMEIESMLIDRLKKVYIAPKGHLVKPWFSLQDNVPGSIVAVGASNSGKSHFFTNLLISEAWQNVMLFVISMTPVNKDPSLKKLITHRKKKLTVFLDPEKINDQLSMELLAEASKNRKIFVYIDDVLDVLQDNKETAEGYVKKLVLDLTHKILTKGRHVSQGISTGVALHKSKQGKSTEMLWGEATNLVVFPRSKHTLYPFLIQKFALAKSTLNEIFDLIGNSRILAFHFEAPIYCVWDGGAMLL